MKDSPLEGDLGPALLHMAKNVIPQALLHLVIAVLLDQVLLLTALPHSLHTKLGLKFLEPLGPSHERVQLVQSGLFGAVGQHRLEESCGIRASIFVRTG